MKDDFFGQDVLDCCLVCGPNCVCCIRASGACVEFDGNLVLDDVSFSVGSGVLSALVGPNAGGKSTLFNAIAGVQEIAHGSIYVNGLSPKDSRGSISYIPQRENVNWRFSLTAEEVVNLGLVKNTSMFGFSKKKNSKMVESA
ncbi:MAG: ATP-binding cassette domain-containing protein, partial [Chloroflexota bacterium]|nr:ATP-binding cassette domain-containing protein [Chloroflexota bacterium]